MYCIACRCVPNQNWGEAWASLYVDPRSPETRLEALFISGRLQLDITATGQDTQLGLRGFDRSDLGTKKKT